MKTIQLTITDEAFSTIKTEVFAAALSHNASGPHAAWKLVIDAMERGDTEKTISMREEKENL
jgi:hypothetical protein